MSAQAGVLAVMDAVAGDWTEAGHPDFTKARNDVAELIEAATKANEDFIEATSYAHEDDEAGWRVCCGVRSYSEHEPNCTAVRLRAALARVTAP